MCSDNEFSKVLKKGVQIDAPIRKAIDIAFEVLEYEGYDETKDKVSITTQYIDQLTTVSYTKTAILLNEKTGIPYRARFYVISVPDQYVPSTTGKVPENALQTMDDIKTFLERCREEEEEN